MHILEISINAIRRSRDGKRILGDVTFCIEKPDGGAPNTLRVSCDTVYSKRIRPDAILIGDAIRQIRRLPELRNGTDRLTFAKNLRPLSPQMDRQAASG